MENDGAQPDIHPLGDPTRATAGDSLEATPLDATQPVIGGTPAQSLISQENYAEPQREHSWQQRIRRILLWLVVVLIIVGSIFVLVRRSAKVVEVRAGSFNQVHVPLSKFAASGSLPVGTAQSLSVNGQLQISNSLVLTPSLQPSAPVIGQIYYDETTNQLAFYNGTQFLNLAGTTIVQNTTNNNINNVTNLSSATGTVTAVGGSAGVLAKFTGGQSLGASIASDDGTTLTVSGNINLLSSGSADTELHTFAVSNAPAIPNNADPNPSEELGVKFKTDVSGFVRGIRFYKGNLMTGTHTGTLWTSSGTQLATGTFTNETASGWQEMRFASPVAISADTTYVASYHNTSGFYAATIHYFQFSGVNNGVLHILQNGDDGANGVFKYNATTTFPTTGFNQTNYWADVVFAPNPLPNRFQVNNVQISSSDLSNNSDLAKRGSAQIFTGKNVFRNSVDSTSVFGIQNAASTNMFTVDTTDDQIILGPSGGDNTGTLLVLGTKNNLGDPAGVEGAIYYNNGLRSFRCFRFGQWDNCASLEVDHSFLVYDEFLGGQTTTLGGATNIGSLGWNAQAIGANGSIDFNPATPTPVANRPGVLQLQTPAVANQGTTLLLANSTGASMILSKDNVVKTSVAVGAATGQVLRVGLDSETTGTARPLSGVWWEANPAIDARWQFCYGDGTTVTCSPSTATITANTWVTLEIRILATGAGTSSATFIINGSFSQVTNKTIDSTNRLSPALSCYATTASAQNCYWDYFQLKGTTSAAR